ncbi:MAG: hypothetical protein ACE5HB_03455, partial [Terriglobia bacterium]
MNETDSFWKDARRWEELVEKCREFILDPDFPTVRAWKQRQANAKALGCFPVYTPQALIAASGSLPVSLF